MRPFSICPPVGSHIPFSGRLCMPAPSVCFWTPRLSLGHPGSFMSVHELKCMRTQTAPLFNVPRGRRGTTTRVVHLYPHCTCPSRAYRIISMVYSYLKHANFDVADKHFFFLLFTGRKMCTTSTHPLI